MSATALLAGRHALVTGAGSGIGAAIARALAGAGALVSLAGRRREPLETWRPLLPAGAALVVDGFDVTDAEAIGHGLDRARAAFGPVSILVNNAGEAPSASFERTDADLWARMCSRSISPASTRSLMRRCRISSATARRASHQCRLHSGPDRLRLCRRLLRRQARRRRAYPRIGARTCSHGVTANAVCPGFTETPLIERAVETIVTKTGRSGDAARAELAR